MTTKAEQKKLDEQAAEAEAQAASDVQDEAAMDAAGVATAEANAELEHTAGGITTRDGMDAGVPMRQGEADEPVGPEDAFAPGEKRGDYSERLSSGPHMETVDLGPQESLDVPRYVLRPVAPGPQAG